MPKLEDSTTTKPIIDRSPKFKPDGQRVLLSAQREYTTWENFLSIVFIPVSIWRVVKHTRQCMRLSDEEGEEIDHLPDPTVIVPTGKLLHTNLIDHVPEEVYKRRKEEREKREKIELENKERFERAELNNTQSRKSRSERLKEIDRRPRFTKDKGERIILLTQRRMTKLEGIFTMITLPLFCIKAFIKFRKAQNKVRSIGNGQNWKMMMVYLEDPTFIIPTGSSYYNDDELVHYEDLDKSLFEEEEDTSSDVTSESKKLE
ncbi:uncharacterized protein L201_001525 [Kwoniella dendrophila CBS 6074]|uniref:Uncharacterized protein n=1 Tax=Kwoniella dendrophila CBS 6074 TaxID=1295534 RepID=A0AAX4JP44_9TREE